MFTVAGHASLPFHHSRARETKEGLLLHKVSDPVSQGLCQLFFLGGGNEAFSARKTIAELWDGRLRWDIGLVCAAGGRMVASRGGRPRGAHAWAPHPGRGYPSGNPQGHPRSGHPPSPCHGGTSPECLGRDRRTGIGVPRGWNTVAAPRIFPSGGKLGVTWQLSESSN